MSRHKQTGASKDLTRVFFQTTIECVYIESLVWTRENRAHIAEHHVTPSEVEELFFEDRPHFRRGPGENLYHVYGQSDVGRYLFVVMIYLGRGKGYIVTARDMDKKERRLYRTRIPKS